MDESTETQSWSRKEVFSTGEAAKICNISQQTIIRCFDCGFLQGFRVPGSRFRRIPRDELIRFMKAYEIPVDLLERSAWRILVLDVQRQTAGTVRRLLGDDDGFELQIASNGYDAGALTERFHPHLIIVAASSGLHWPKVLRAIRDNPHLGEMKVALIVAADDQDDPAVELADAVLSRPLREASLRECLDSLLPLAAEVGV